MNCGVFSNQRKEEVEYHIKLALGGTVIESQLERELLSNRL